jgi:signal transduction histidine kinase
VSVDLVTVDWPSDLMVWVTPSHLSQMVTNLVTNALRHGAPPFAVCAEPAGAEVRISVTDAGAGVHGLLVERMFERYVRGAADGQSAGLGLAIVRALAEANDGSVRYEAGDPVGSRFVLTLPAPPC